MSSLRAWGTLESACLARATSPNLSSGSRRRRTPSVGAAVDCRGRSVDHPAVDSRESDSKKDQDLQDHVHTTRAKKPKDATKGGAVRPSERHPPPDQDGENARRPPHVPLDPYMQRVVVHGGLVGLHARARPLESARSPLAPNSAGFASPAWPASSPGPRGVRGGCQISRFSRTIYVHSTLR